MATTTFYVKVRAQDSLGAWSGWSPTTSMTIRLATPSTPDIGAPSSVYIGSSYTYSAATNGGHGSVRYTFYWGDGTSWTSGWVSSGTRVYRSHTHAPGTTPGTYWLVVTVENSLGVKNDYLKKITVINRTPNTPGIPSGPSSSVTGSTYTFSFLTTEPDGHSISHKIDWGDGSITRTGYYSSGTRIYRSHLWAHGYAGGIYYYIKVRAKDNHGAWSSWSLAKSIKITDGSGRGGPGITSIPNHGEEKIAMSSTTASTPQYNDMLIFINQEPVNTNEVGEMVTKNSGDVIVNVSLSHNRSLFHGTTNSLVAVNLSDDGLSSS